VPKHTTSNVSDPGDSGGLIAPAVGHDRPGGGALAWYKRFAQDEIALSSRMSLAGFGANVKLRDQAWMQSPLPADDAWLARLLGCTVKEFRSIHAEALNGFVQDDAGLWHPAIEAERQDADKRRTRTVAATEARWRNNQGGRNAQRNGLRDEERNGVHNEQRGAPRNGVRDVSAPAPAPALAKEKKQLRRGAGSGTSVAVGDADRAPLGPKG
jgi:uncharacterized protein YdaU (DUF1376 family)